VTLSFTCKRQVMETAKLSTRLKRVMKHFLPSFDLFYGCHKNIFIASTIPHLL